FLQLSWTGVPTTDNAGLYETWFTDDNGKVSVSLTTHGETMHTRKWMPCFDEPLFKVPLKLWIEHPSHLTALSNGRLLSIDKTSTRWMSSFEKTWPVPSYLYAFSVTDYVGNASDVDGLPVSVFVPSPLSFLLPRIMKDVKESIKISLPRFNAVHLNSKLDFVFFPDHTSAMENPGHISLATEFHDKKATLVHEMMHQYFGNLVTLEWWSDLWINEGLANYYEDLALAGNNTKSLLLALRHLRDSSLDDDVFDTSLPLHNKVHTFIDSRLMFRNPYTKGAMVMNMLRDFVGKEEFDDVNEKLLNERTNSTLSLQQFYSYLSTTRSAQNAVNIARDFLEQAGYPLLVIRRVKGSTRIRQVRFHRGFVNEMQRDFDTRWTIPIYLTTLDGRYSRTVVMQREEIEVPHSEFLIVDPNRIVNYRVIYDENYYEEIRGSAMREEDKDLMELDLLEAASMGYADIVTAYYTIMRR
ncbi:hypothetical protein PMAYCL1PPCAC_29967, partial [Pristionchus mayeri]